MGNLFENLKKYRLRNHMTQENVATYFHITPQSVSKWERGENYPDMEIIPSIANLYGVSIDELFGYENEREKKVEALIGRIDALNKQNNGVDVCVDECLALAREGMAEFPGNEKVMLCLATVLYNAGYVRYGEYHLTDEDGYGYRYDIYDVERHKTYAEWQEAIGLYEKLLTSSDNGIRCRASTDLSQLYLNVGLCEKSMELAEAAPTFQGCKEFLRYNGCDGAKRAEILGENLLLWAKTTAEFMIWGVMINRSNFTAEEAARILQNAAALFDLVCPDKNYGSYNGILCRIYLYLSEHLWLAGRHDDAFEALDAALHHAKMCESFSKDEKAFYTAPLLRRVKVNPDGNEIQIAKYLPEDWPWWCVPDCSKVKEEMQSDSRWEEWVKKTQA